MKERIKRLEVALRKQHGATPEKLTADYIDKLTAYFTGDETGEAVIESFNRIQAHKERRR